MQSNNEVSESVFILLVSHSIKYILSKKVDKKQSKAEIEELGSQLGVKIVNYLLTTRENPITRTKKEDKDYMEYIMSQAWYFVFKDNNVIVEKKGEGKFVITCGDLRMFNYLSELKNLNANNDVLDSVLVFIAAMLKGFLSVFNLDSSVIPSVQNYSTKCLKNLQKTQYVFTFEVNILNNLKGN